MWGAVHIEIYTLAHHLIRHDGEQFQRDQDAIAAKLMQVSDQSSFLFHVLSATIPGSAGP